MSIPRLPGCLFTGSLVWIGLLALLTPLVPAPLDDPRWHGVRTLVVEIGSVALLLLLLTRPWTVERRKNGVDALRATPLCFLTALAAWGCLSAILAPAKPFAWQGLLQVLAGLMIVLTVAGDARERPQYEILLDALIGATLFISVSGFVLYGQNRLPMAVGLYHDHMLYGAVFTILLPLMLAVSLAPSGEARRLLAQAALLSGLIALVMAQTRSSWIGVAAALLVFACLFLFARASVPRPVVSSGEQRARRLQTILLSGAAFCALGYFVIAAPQTAQVGQRLRTLTTTVPQGREDSVAWRIAAWQGARQMIAQKPMLGWGIGSYPRFQYAFTGMGHEDPALTLQGPTILDEAHNSYLQIAVEMGLPGLLLWLGVLISAFVLGISALRRFTPGGLRQWALIGCLSALAGQAVDAVANPGWQFAEVSLFLWIALGLTLALSLGVPAVDGADRAETPGRLAAGIVLALKMLPALAVGAGLLWLIWQAAWALPAPKL